MASSPWSPSTAAAAVPGAHAYDMRPLSLSEILDRIFSIYRARFLLFAGLASIPATVQLITGAVQLLITHGLRARLTMTGQRTSTTLIGLGFSFVIFLLFAVMHAATVFALGELYLGRTVEIGEAAKVGLAHWARYMGIAVWQVWSAGWVAAVCLIPAFLLVGFAATGSSVLSGILGGLLMFVGFVGGGVLGVIFYLRNALAVPASVIEGLPVRPAMRRSKQLALGAKGRLFVVILISVALYYAGAALESPLIFVVARGLMRNQEVLWAQAVMLFVGFLISSLVTPVTLIGFALIYFDQRVRKEAFDLELMLDAPVAAAPAPEPAGAPAQPSFFTPAGPLAQPADGIYEALVARPSAPQAPLASPEPIKGASSTAQPQDQDASGA